jgi:antitoxin ParD1/3/4
MVIQIPTDLEESIRAKAESGLYHDPSEVIRTAMCLLDRRDQRLQELRASIQEGLAAIERGEGREWTPELMEEISQEASKRARLGVVPKPDVCP